MTDAENADLRRLERAVSRHFPLIPTIAFIFTMLLQFGVSIWWASQQSQMTADHDRRIDAIESSMKPLDGRLSRIEALLETLVNRADREDRAR